MQDALRAYLELALGMTEASRKRATKVVEGLVGRGGEFVGKGGATAKQVQTMAGDLIATSAANREALVKLVRFEVDRALGAVGLATAEEVGDLTSRLRDLERQLDHAQSRLATAAKKTAKKAAAKKSPAKKAAAKTAGPRPTAAAAKKAPARTSGRTGTAGGAKRTPARKATSRAARS